MTIPTNSEKRAMQARYRPPKGSISHWEVIHCNVAVCASVSPAYCERYIKENQLKNAYKKPIYK